MTSDNITDTQMQEYAVSTPAKKAIDDLELLIKYNTTSFGDIYDAGGVAPQYSIFK